MAHSQALGAPGHSARDPFSEISKNLRACMQCGTCTGSCGSAAKMDYTPRQVWRMVQSGLKEELFTSRTFWLCSSCYYCTLRCPRGLPLTDTMAALKRVATAEKYANDRKSPPFYKAFLDSVRKYGRVREAEMMTRYFLAVKNPALPLSFVPLGMKLLAKGKMELQLPGVSRGGKLERLYKKVMELEAAQ
ncbi:MAG: 4Fe-4S dicluster domain-containing protein [Syntrophobacteraceae bacterium]|nr:4Fe-4S dicluster domain-containing protein [Syntrophobacteraceae bacterium]